MTSYLYSLFLNYATKVMLFFYIQTKNYIFLRRVTNLLISLLFEQLLEPGGDRMLLLLQ